MQPFVRDRKCINRATNNADFCFRFSKLPRSEVTRYFTYMKLLNKIPNEIADSIGATLEKNNRQ